jgi:N-acetylmuramoyl-L-alanine amidase
MTLRRLLPRLLALAAESALLRCASAQPFSSEPLSYVAHRFALSDPQSAQGRIVMHGSLYALAFDTGSRKLSFDGTLIWMNAPIMPRGGVWLATSTDVAGTLAPLLYPRDALQGRRANVVILDPGHGGEDSGAMGARKSMEKRVVFDVACRVRDKLAKCGVTALMTRDRDLTLTLDDRTRFAAKRHGDLFVSIHLNSSPNRQAGGTETYLLTPAGFASTASATSDLHIYAGNANDPANILLAYYIHRGVISTTGEEDRGIKHARFEVLRDAPCPAALVECAFISNSREEQALLTEGGRDRVSEGIARGILTYVSRTEAANAPTAHP